MPRREVTTDGDFGGSPMFFGSYVGACNKNGVFYALSQATMRLIWWKRIASASGGTGECDPTPAYNGADLFFGGGKISIHGKQYPGSVQERTPGTGRLVWATPSAATSTAAPRWMLAASWPPAPSPPPHRASILIDATTGDVIEQLQAGPTFGQSAFARDWLLPRTATARSLGTAGELTPLEGQSECRWSSLRHDAGGSCPRRCA